MGFLLRVYGKVKKNENKKIKMKKKKKVKKVKKVKSELLTTASVLAYRTRRISRKSRAMWKTRSRLH